MTADEDQRITGKTRKVLRTVRAHPTGELNPAGEDLSPASGPAIAPEADDDRT
jgi:hypothetical protein